MTLDTSHVSWIATANSVDDIPEPILSRFQIIHIRPLSSDAKQSLIETLAKQTIRTMGLQLDVHISSDVKDIDASTRSIKNALFLSMAQKYKNDPLNEALNINASDLSRYMRIKPPTTYSVGFTPSCKS